MVPPKPPARTLPRDLNPSKVAKAHVELEPHTAPTPPRPPRVRRQNCFRSQDPAAPPGSRDSLCQELPALTSGGGGAL